MDNSEINSSSDLQSLDNNPDSIVPESDNDSGIVAIANSNRIGSTASNSDEDNLFKDKLNQSANHPFGYEYKPRVRFDDELPLSEQNMRKSCKKLFETLWHQNKDNTTLKEESVSSQPSLLPSCHCQHFAQTLPHFKTNSQVCNHSDHTSSIEVNVSYDDNELLLTNYGQQTNYNRDVPISQRHKYNSLDNRQSRRTLDKNVDNPIDCKSFKKKSFDCDEALDRIKRMTDQLESSSMVNAFARPAFIKSAEYGQTMDTLYETIFPTEKTPSNNQVKQWLNKVDLYERQQEIDDSPLKNNNECDAIRFSNKNSTPDQNRKKLIIREIPKVVNTLTPTKSSYISADQIYPDQCEDDITNEELERSFEERNNRFSNSYSAGEDSRKGILRHRIKSAMSEMDLNQKSSPKSKGFLSRFKSVLSRAFTNDKLTKQSVVDINTIQNSRSLSQTDVRVDINLRSSRSSIALDGRNRVDRSPSFVKNLKTRMSFRRNKVNSPERISRSNSHKNLTLDNQRNRTPKQSKPENDNNDCNVWGELIKLNSDSSQVIQIHRQKGRAFGFFVARGTVNNVKGVFISRMKDEETQKCLTGVLEIGDEILAIDGESVKEANIMRVNQLITNKDTIRLTIVPYMNNKYL